MKKLLAAFVLVVMLAAVLAPSASAYYRMSYGQAKQETKRFEEGVCEETADCVAYAVGFPCLRRSASAFDCTMGIFHEEIEGELECNTIIHWGVSRTGYIVLKGSGSPNCFLV